MWVLETPPRGFFGSVQVLNSVYAFTREHLMRFSHLLQRLDISDVYELKYRDDLILSYTGVGDPQVHYSGQVLRCATSEKQGIAVYKQPDFYPQRLKLLRALRQLRIPTRTSDPGQFPAPTINPPDSRKKEQGILVLGMHRSGTSALTRVVNLLGVTLGNQILVPKLSFRQHP